MRHRSIDIVGGGRVAQALGRALTGCGWRVEFIPSRAPVQGGRALLICVADDALAEVTSSVARAYSAGEGVVLHTSGAHGPEILAPLAAKGFDCGTLHPLQTVSGETTPDALQGVAFAISGDDNAIAFAEQIAAALHGIPLRIRAEHRAQYHAAAVLASNYVAALIHAAERLFQSAGVSESDARRALAPLIRRSVENSLERGPTESLTGPIRRGDAGTVKAHLAALDSAPENLRLLYRACGAYTLDIAREGGLAAELAGPIEKLLKCKTH